MKKTLLSIAALLPCFIAHSQEAEDFGRYAEVSVITRLDAAPSYNSSSSEFGFDLGNSSLYTLFEGSLSEHFSWTVANHWTSSGGDYAWPYKNLGRSDSTNWLDYFLADFTLGNWTFSLGKDMITTGGFEFDEWDWDVYSQTASPLWNNLSCYQWGGKVAYTTPSEMSRFSLQMTSSPYGEHPFSSGLWAYSVQWAGEYGPYSNIASVSAIQYDKNDYYYLISLGQNLDLDAWTVGVDWSNSFGSDDELHFGKGGTFSGLLSYSTSDKFTASLRGSYIYSPDAGLLGDRWIASGLAEWFPLHESDELRLHAMVSYDSFLEQATLCVGARWNLRFRLC